MLCARGGMPLERPAPELRRMLEGEGAQRMAGVPVHEDDALAQVSQQAQQAAGAMAAMLLAVLTVSALTAQVWRLELTPTRLVVRLSEPELTNRVLRSFTGPGGLDMCSLVSGSFVLACAIAAHTHTHTHDMHTQHALCCGAGAHADERRARCTPVWCGVF